MRWWLISDDDVKYIREALQDAAKLVDDNCAETACLCDLLGVPCSGQYIAALHRLDSGLHITNAVPEDLAG